MTDFVLATFFCYVGAFLFGMFVGGILEEKQCARAEMSDPQPAWWRKAKILAKAAVDAEEEK